MTRASSRPTSVGTVLAAVAPAVMPAAPARPARGRRLGTFRLVREGPFPAPAGYRDPRQPVRTPRDAFTLMAPYVARELGESFWILALDAKGCTRGPTVITRGILDASLVHPREVFLAAICAHAASVVLVHNHPSGDTTPSAEDRVVTTALVAAGRLLDIPVRDHVIVGASGYTSFVEAGLLP